MEVALTEDGPHNVSAGQSFTLTCIATLAPRTDVEWKLNWLDSNNNNHENNTNLTTTNANTGIGAQKNIFVLDFHQIFLSDADVYTCQAIANYSGGSQVKMATTSLYVESE